VQDTGGDSEPIDMEIHIAGSDKDSGSLSTLDLPGTTTKKAGSLSVIQKSRLSNWAEHHFLCANKIMGSYDEVANDIKELHQAICKVLGIEESDWAHVGAEAIKKLRSAMSDRVSLHQKIVKGL
jgi:hypothetical protein